MLKTISGGWSVRSVGGAMVVVVSLWSREDREMLGIFI